MKKILLILVAAICFNAYGQLEYTFAKSTSTYTPLTGNTVVKSAWIGDFITKTPFQFEYFGKKYDSLNILPNSVSFTSYKADIISMGSDNYYFDGELYPVGSEISYNITGTAGDRIIKVQFKNLRSNTSDSTEEYTVNNQIWLYEKGGKFQFHFGPNVITDVNFDQFFFGFIDYDNSPYLAISGTATSPVLFHVLTAGTFKGIPTHPTDGTVYTFDPYVPSSNISTIDKPYSFANTQSGFSVYSINASTLTVTNVLGQIMETKKMDVGSTLNYNTSGLPLGMYLLTIISDNKTFTEKIIVQ